MSVKSLLGFTLTLCLAGSALAETIIGPTVNLSIDGANPLAVPLLLRALPGAPGVIAFESDPQFGDGSVRFSGLYKSDPFLELNVTFTDSAEPTPLIITMFGLVSGGPYGMMFTNLGGTPPVDRLVSVDGTTLDAGIDSGSGLVFDPALQLTIPNCNSVVGCGPATTASINGVFNPVLMAIQIGFTGPGGGNTVSFNGRLDIETGDANIPEPASLSLLAGGLASLAWFRRRTR